MNKLLHKISNLKLNTKFTIVIFFIVMIPVSVLLGMLTYNTEKTTRTENLAYMDYGLERNEKQLNVCVDSVNMVTQFFLSDSGILELLNASVTGKSFDTDVLLDYYDNDIAALERLVSNNPLLYGVRVYAVNDKVQEMMPILYSQSRMEQMDWFSSDRTGMEGWHFNHYDTLFASIEKNEDEPLASYVTAVRDYHNGLIGYIEVVIRMETMFPELYSDNAYEWQCLLSGDGERIYGNKGAKEKAGIFTKMMDRVTDTTEATSFYLIDREDQHWAVSYLPVKVIDGGMISVRNVARGSVNRILSPVGLVLMLLIIMVLLAYFTKCVVKHLLRHLYDILKTIRHVQKGKLNERIEVVSQDEMGELATQLNHMLDRIQVLMKENFDRELLAKNSQIRALQNQINAHFIYNVLESIKMMAEIDEEYRISDSVTSLGILLRYSMRWASGNVLIREELEYIRNYISLINLRFDNEITLAVNLPEELMEQEIPKMSLQPLVENSILHGLEELTQDSTIYIKGRIEDSDCVIEVSDEGIGMPAEQLEKLREKIAGKLEAGGGDGHGIGLKNVQDRIHIAFGQEYGLRIQSKEGCYTKVEIRIPRGLGESISPTDNVNQVAMTRD